MSSGVNAWWNEVRLTFFCSVLPWVLTMLFMFFATLAVLSFILPTMRNDTEAAVLAGVMAAGAGLSWANRSLIRHLTEHDEEVHEADTNGRVP